jgi:outer membrane biosynthesis protein TonB
MKVGLIATFLIDFIEVKSGAKALKAQTMKYLPDKRKPVEEGLSPRQKEKIDKEKEEKERKEKERTEKEKERMEKDKERAEKEKKEREEKERKDKEKEKKEKDKRSTKDKDAGVAEGLRRQSVGAWNALKSMINNDKT